MGHPASYADEVGRDLFDGDERTRLCDLLEALGPDAPTVLEPWTTRDLAAHLYLRENDPLAGPGLVLPGPWARFAERHQQLAARRDYLQLVARVRSGPRAVFRLGWVRRVPNLNELFVHHEDVRRANGGSRRDPSLRPIVSPRQRNPNVRVVEALDPEVRKAGGDLLADQP
jgi:uncharacterized protein (TIGR03085 family)